MNLRKNSDMASIVAELLRPRSVAAALLLGFAMLASASTITNAQETNAPAAVAAEDEPDMNLRDPFLPPGYAPRVRITTPEIKPPAPVGGATNNIVTPPPEAPGKWPQPPSVKGLTKVEGRWRAILDNGIGLVEAGENIRQRVGNYIFIWKVAAITDKGVSLKPVEMRSAK